MITVTRTSMPPLEEYVAYLERIWPTAYLTNNGPLCCELAALLKGRLCVDNLELVANGTLALQLAMKALDIRGEVITTPYSYVATTNAILWESCDPVFVDVDPQTLCIDPALIESAISPHTSAILATHVYGYPCDVDAIQEIADRHGLRVIYDAAHAFGVKLNGRSLLSYGDCSTLSFHSTKLFHCGEGGAVVSRTPELSQRVFLMTMFGHCGEERYVEIGINAKMSELHAAMGLSVLPQVDDLIARRRRSSERYDALLDGLALQRPKVAASLDYNYAYYPVLFEDHASMMRARRVLLDHDIMPRRYFFPSLNTLPFLREALRRPCPVSESAASRVLALPLSAMLEDVEIDAVVRCIREALGS